jgi:hypothetical protein
MGLGAIHLVYYVPFGGCCGAHAAIGAGREAVRKLPWDLPDCPHYLEHEAQMNPAVGGIPASFVFRIALTMVCPDLHQEGRASFPLPDCTHQAFEASSPGCLHR